MSWILEIL